MKPHVHAALVLVILCLPGPLIAGTTRNVPTGPYRTIQSAIDACVDGDTVLVADGTYTGFGNKNLDFGGRAITVQSQNGPAVTIIDCEDSGRGFYFHTGETTTSVVEGFTITNGSADRGGGIYCVGSSPTIADCTVTGNTAALYGGGIECLTGASLTIRDCTISGNSAGNAGGGIDCYDGSNPTVVNCVIAGNVAVYGAGIHCEIASPNVTNCTITGNEADWGGGIYCLYSSSPAITNCTITGNSADNGGGGIFCLDRSSPTITNCAISGNSTNSWGGGIYCLYSSSPAITNCTITGNSADNGGGGITTLNYSSPTITNCILWGNAAPGGHEIALTSTTHPSTLTVRYSDVEGGAGEAYVEAGCTLDLDGTNIDDDPLFVSGPLGGYYLSQLAAGQGADSPCVDTGSDTAANLGLDTRTTRTDHVEDAATVDMGYHSPHCLGGIPGDVDGNGVVDGLDLTAVITAWQTQPADALWNPSADLDCNGLIDGLDLTEVISNWTTAAAAAPEGSGSSSALTSDTDTSRRGNVKRGRGNASKGNARRK
jgi:parallel beta-helix repeat protein